LKQIAIGKTAGQTRIAIREEGKLVELVVQSAEQELLGNVYRGRVADVVPGLQAAFIDIGIGQNAYLYIDDVEPAADGRELTAGKPGIGRLLQRGASLLVQVAKEGIGGKAPRVTTRISIPGRTLVYQPAGREIAVSRRITDERQRERLRQLIEALLAEGEGAILRTSAAAVPAERITAELCGLRQAWQEALANSRDGRTPQLVYQADDLVLRMMRDHLSADVTEVVVEDAATYRKLKQEIQLHAPELSERIRLHRDKQPLFAALGIDAELDKALRRQVWLKSGGFIVIEQTEAMTVIDVNTGKFTGRSSQQLEETATATNLEAAAEIARQLRLRNIAGIIMIDFIDMKREANRARVLEYLQQQLAQDRTATYVCGFTRLGLVEMTRKRMRPSLGEALTVPCPACSGRGRVLSPAELAGRLEAEVAGLVKTQEVEAVVVELPAAVFEHFLAEERREWKRLEQQWQLTMYLLSSEALSPSQYRILYAGGKQEASRRWQNKTFP